MCPDFVWSLIIRAGRRIRLLVLFHLLIEQIVNAIFVVVLTIHKLLNDNLWRRLPSLDLQQLLVVFDIWLLDFEEVILNIELHVLKLSFIFTYLDWLLLLGHLIFTLHIFLTFYFDYKYLLCTTL